RGGPRARSRSRCGAGRAPADERRRRCVGRAATHATPPAALRRAAVSASGGKACASSADRIKRVVLAMQAALAAGRAGHLEHALAPLAEVASKAGAVMTGALHRPGANTTR